MDKLRSNYKPKCLKCKYMFPNQHLVYECYVGDCPAKKRDDESHENRTTY